ncbi:MAG TPA: TetR/AcrR family transcriptional regulator [Bacillus sp. (in: firmicutes)]
MARNKEYDENEVLRKAMELFWKQGYEKTSMQDLVTHMGIHRRSMYDTFGDKHALFMKALERYDEIVETKIDTQVKLLDSAKQAIRRLFEMAIRQNEQQPIGCLTVNTAVELSLHDEEAAEKVVESFSKTESLLYELLLRGQKSGEVSDHHDVERLTQFIHNSLVGLRVLAKTTDDKQKLENIIDMTLSVLD